jgi:CRISPR system Cascade subunit CasE
MYLSHFCPDVSLKAKLSDPDQLHRAVWRFFHFDREARRGFLFRQEAREVVVVSQIPPLPRLPGWTSRVGRFEPKLEHGDTFLFRVRVNPTISSDGKRFDRIQRRLWQDPTASLNQVIAEEGQAWLREREVSMGFCCLDPGPQVGDYRKHRFYKNRPGRPTGRPLLIATLEISGAAVVTDPTRLHHTLIHGVGHAKGYGCGLMLTQKLEEAFS